MAYKNVLHLERVTIFDWNPTICMPSCCPRTTFSSMHYSSNQGDSAIFPPYKTEYIFSKRYRNVANFSSPLERFELFPWIKNYSVSGPTFLYRRIRQPGVWRFLQQLMVPRTVAARVPFSYGATKHCLERTLPDLSCLHALGPPMVRQANTPLVR